MPSKLLDGRWKVLILFHLFGGKVLRFSDLERAIPEISQKMLAQQLRQIGSRWDRRTNRPPPGSAEGGVSSHALRPVFVPGTRCIAPVVRGAPRR